MCTILFALNEKYDPASKRVEKYLDILSIKPKDFLKRFESMLRGPFDNAGRIRTVKEAQFLFEELLEIITTKSK